ncbi:MAG: AAA family ATPase, partial [Alphaproteobacteria bacterium]|nr:AAA family ATPase [Alphaproteobacteria bacterium]
MTDSHVVEDQSAVIAFLADPDTHAARSGPAPEVERIDTHGAVVFLAGDRAWKLKRAVDYPYMDLSTLAKRERACRAEIALNRRTAPSIYLAARPIVPAGDGHAFGDAEADRDRAVDWVVEMRRFDQDGLLDRLADRDALTVGLCEDLAVAVADLHRQAEPHFEATPKAMQWVVEENLEEFAEDPELFPPDRVALLGERAEAALARHWELMERRCRNGRVRRCHGDLHLRNVVAIDGRPVIFDAIEFNDRLATVDGLYDLAFLLMDLDHRDLRGHGNRVLNRYLEEDEQDEALALLPLYLSTRAAVRAKVSASIAAAVTDAGARAHHRDQAGAYLAMALAYLDPDPPRLVAVGGLSGTGKTTAARAVAPSIGPSPGAVILRSDILRKQLSGVARTEPLPESAYTPEASARVYDRIAGRAAT